MAQQNSFDIVSQVDSAEITNALNQTIKEVRQRFDFKGSHANVVHEKNELVLTAEDETKLRNMNNGSLIDKRLRSVDQVEVPYVETKEYEYLYSASDDHVFMDTETYDQLKDKSDASGSND